VQNPNAQQRTFLGIANVTNKLVATSGVYEHYFMKNGKRYLMDTSTGCAVDKGLQSETVHHQLFDGS
jgi:thiamine biosynthesis lipoprotein